MKRSVLAAVALFFALHAPVSAKPAAEAQSYLYATYPEIAGYVDCIIMGESSWNPDAWNPVVWPPGSGDHAAGLGGFIYSTWLTTPSGQAGYSRYDPYAAIDAVVWMLYQGRAGEFGAVAVGWC